MFNKVDCEIPSHNNEARNPLANRSNRIIVKFSQTKDCNPVTSVKRNLRKVKLEYVELRGVNPIFIDQSLYPYYRMLWFKSKRLDDLGKITNHFISSDKIKIKLQKCSKPLVVTHAKDLKKYFLVVDFFMVIFINVCLILSNICCCATWVHSYYGLFKDFCHGEVFNVESNQFISSWSQLTGSYVLQNFARWNLWKSCKCFLVWVCRCLSHYFPKNLVRNGFHWSSIYN